MQKKFEDGGRHVSQETTGGTEENLKSSSHKFWLPKTGTLSYYDSLIGTA
jgi:hypothetical protein